MNRKLVVLLLLIQWSLFYGDYSKVFAQTAGIRNLYPLVKDTYETKADSLTNAFIESFMIKNKGYFNTSYQNYAFNAYWTQAHAIDVVIYNYQRQKGINDRLARQYLNYIDLWFKNKANNYSGASTSDGSYRMFENPFTDDMCWITLTLMHIGEATGTTKYFTTARQVFDNYIIKRAHEDEETEGLWLPWNTDEGSGPNACTQSPATLIAAKLYKRYGTAKYLEYAKKLFKYTSQKIVKSDGRVEDPPLTYTQGTFGEACRILYHVTDESSTIKNKYKALAYTYINYAFTSDRCTSGGNILRDEGGDGNQSIFKAVLIPYAVNFVLDESMTTNDRKNIFNYILKNTTTLWRNLNFSRYPLVFYNTNWKKPFSGEDKDASMGAACSGSSLFENMARMSRAIIDRYDLGTLYRNASSFVIGEGQENFPEYSALTTAMDNAKAILDNPDDYTTAQFRKAIEELETAYLTAQDFATAIKEVQRPEFTTHGDIYDLSGRKVTNENLPRGIYIIGGRKVVIK